LYSFHFLKTLFLYRVPNFNMLKAIAEILKSILPSIHCCTSVESDNLGIFFLELFTLINEWYKQEVWERDCEGYSGFSRIVGSNQSIRLQDFNEIGNQIQKRFSQNLVKCFEKAEKHPMKAQCALKILNRMLPQFPKIIAVAKYLQKHLLTLVEQKEAQKKDQKLFTLALGCKNNLEKKIAQMDKSGGGEMHTNEEAGKEKGGETSEGARRKQKEREKGMG